MEIDKLYRAARTGRFVRKSETARRKPLKGKHYFPRIKDNVPRTPRQNRELR